MDSADRAASIALSYRSLSHSRQVPSKL